MPIDQQTQTGKSRVEEDRLRRMAARQGLALHRVDSGGTSASYQLISPRTRRPVGWTPADGGLTLVEIERALRDDPR
jgi:hypothetical protein